MTRYVLMNKEDKITMRLLTNTKVFRLVLYGKKIDTDFSSVFFKVVCVSYTQHFRLNLTQWLILLTYD